MELVGNEKNVHISVVSPVYRAELIVDELVRRITEEVSKITNDFEIILVEDCGPDNSWDKIVENAVRDPRIKGIKLSRNFGQHHAITAGLDHASGDWVVVMDCDLQDMPEEIIKLYAKAQEGNDIVYAQRLVRLDSPIKRAGSYIFYRTLGYLAGVQQDHSIANFGIYSKKVIAATVSIREKIRYFPSMIKWVGFKSAVIPVTHAKREQGKTSYNFSKLLQLAVNIILAYSDKPLRLAVKIGMLISLTSFVFALSVVYKFIKGDIVVLGYASLIISIWFLSGVIIILIGVIGLYIGKIFDGVKDRPIYIVDKNVNV